MYIASMEYDVLLKDIQTITAIAECDIIHVMDRSESKVLSVVASAINTHFIIKLANVPSLDMSFSSYIKKVIDEYYDHVPLIIIDSLESSLHYNELELVYSFKLPASYQMNYNTVRLPAIVDFESVSEYVEFIPLIKALYDNNFHHFVIDHYIYNTESDLMHNDKWHIQEANANSDENWQYEIIHKSYVGRLCNGEACLGWMHKSNLDSENDPQSPYNVAYSRLMHSKINPETFVTVYFITNTANWFYSQLSHGN